jgi:putative N6-adenine-specific DNA methylase
MYQYQKTNRYFAQAADDIKDITEAELSALGATELSPSYRGLYFNADRKTLYRINFHSRLINRVLAPLIQFNCHSDKYLYNTAMQIPWEDFISPDHTFAVFATVTHSHIRHSKFAALRLKDAIADYFKKREGRRPSVDTREPDIWFNLYIENNEALISVDTSGGSLHRRGYRQASVSAPMAETLAASIIRYSGWDGSKPLYDPFCGSGTLLCEAFLFASHTPSAYKRKKFGFERLPDFDRALWKQVKQEGFQRITPLPKGLISGSDISQEAVAAAQDNCAVIDPKHTVTLRQQDAFTIDRLENRIIVCNPPYGIRMKRKQDLSGFYKQIGDFLKQHCTGSEAYIYFGERKYVKSLGLHASWKKPLTNGGLDGRLVKYELY